MLLSRTVLYLLLVCSVNFSTVAAARLSLTSSLPSSEPICPGPIQFTCTGTEVGSGLTWRVNDTDHVAYTFQVHHTFPQTVNLNPPLLGVEVRIIYASLSQNSPTTIDIVSTLSSNVSILKGSMIQCRSVGLSEVLSVTNIGAPPPPSSASCSLLQTNEIIIQWSPSFTSQYNVEMYHVVVNPAISSCPSDQMIRPSENYNCPGLVIGTSYSFTVSAINCGNQEGAESTITVYPQPPQPPEVTVFPAYDQNGRLNLTVWWMQQIQSLSERCSFNQLLSYTVVLEDSTRERVDQRMINSNNCSNLCSISFPISSSDQRYYISVNVAGAFGSTGTSTSLNASIPSSFDVSFSSEGCVTSVLCSYPTREGHCFFQYGRDSSYQDLSPSLSTSLNSPLQITVSDAATIHHYQVTINTSSLYLQVRGNFTSGEGARLTSTHHSLLAVGVVLLSVAIVLMIIISCINKEAQWLLCTLSVIGSLLTIISLVLWVALGLYVGLVHENTCDTSWRSPRDGLIISAHVLSDTSFLIAIGGLLFAVIYYKLRGKHKETNENRVYNINTSQTPDDVIEMKANQVYGVSDALHGHGEIVMEKNIVYGGHKEDYTENTEYDYISN